MIKSPELKYITQGVNDLDFSVGFFSSFFNFKEIDNFGIAEEQLKFHYYYENTAQFVNPEGGALFQLVQSDDAKIEFAEPDLSKIGVLGVKIKSRNVNANFFVRRQDNVKVQSDMRIKPYNQKHFHLTTENLLFQIIDAGDNFFAFGNKLNAGLSGAIIGVSDIEKSIEFYNKILGFDKIIFQEQGTFNDFKNLKGGDLKYKRVLLQQSDNQQSIFGNLLGKSEIELLECLDTVAEKTIDFEFSGLNFISSNPNDIIGNNYNFGGDFELDIVEDNLIHFTDPDGVKISIQKIKETKISVVSELKILSKLIKSII